MSLGGAESGGELSLPSTGLRAAVTGGPEMSPAQASSKGQLCFGTGSLEQLRVPSHAQHRGAAGADSGWLVPAVLVLPSSWARQGWLSGRAPERQRVSWQCRGAQGQAVPAGCRDTHTGAGTIAVTCLGPRAEGAPSWLRAQRWGSPAPWLYPGTATQPCAPQAAPTPHCARLPRLDFGASRSRC